MRYGFTTGSCAAAAAKAAAYMLLTGTKKEKIEIITPKGIPFPAVIEEITREETKVTCAVRKDGGDDPDVTTGALIFATVRIIDRTREKTEDQILIDGGDGIGRVTKRGLDQPVGAAAINRVPRAMIRREVSEVCAVTDYRGGLHVMIFVPEGERLADKTFNPRLGIVGGISILGTTGIVEPMSSQAMLDTIRAELKMIRAQGNRAVAIAPGNYGQEYMRSKYQYDLDQSVKCSNFIGNTIDMAIEEGFTELLLTGHIGKLIKLSGGIMNTHSKEGDCRMELMAAAGLEAGINADTARAILACVSTEEALEILWNCHLMGQTMEIIMDKACDYLKKRAAGRMQIECMMYAKEYAELTVSNGAKSLLARINKKSPE